MALGLVRRRVLPPFSAPKPMQKAEGQLRYFDMGLTAALLRAEVVALPDPTVAVLGSGAIGEHKRRAVLPREV